MVRRTRFFPIDLNSRVLIHKTLISGIAHRGVRTKEQTKGKIKMKRTKKESIVVVTLLALTIIYAIAVLFFGFDPLSGIKAADKFDPLTAAAASCS